MPSLAAWHGLGPTRAWACTLTPITTSGPASHHGTRADLKSLTPGHCTSLFLPQAGAISFWFHFRTFGQLNESQLKVPTCENSIFAFGLFLLIFFLPNFFRGTESSSPLKLFLFRIRTRFLRFLDAFTVSSHRTHPSPYSTVLPFSDIYPWALLLSSGSFHPPIL